MIFKNQYLKSLKQFFETKKWVSKNRNNVCSNAIYLLMEKTLNHQIQLDYLKLPKQKY